MFALMTDEQIGKLMKAVWDFQMKGWHPDFDDPMLRIAWMNIQSDFDQDEMHEEDLHKKRSEAGKKGRKKQASDSKC